MAGISVPEARLIVIQPWDASVLKEIEKDMIEASKKLDYEKAAELRDRKLAIERVNEKQKFLNNIRKII